MYLTLKQRNKLKGELGLTALYVFEFYLSKAGVNNYDYDDKKVARSLEMTSSAVRKIRLKLTKYGIFKKIVTHNARLNISHTSVTLGKQGDDIKYLEI